MDWINRLADQKEEAEHRRQKLTDGAVRLFAMLDVGIAEAVKVYNQRVTRPTANEAAHHDAAVHSVDFGVTAPPVGGAAGVYAASPNSPRVTLNLHAPSVISAVYSGNRAAEIFTVELDDKACACLKHGDKPVDIEAATEIILGTFFFGETAAP
jgi:hypothetical protein